MIFCLYKVKKKSIAIITAWSATFNTTFACQFLNEPEANALDKAECSSSWAFLLTG